MPEGSKKLLRAIDCEGPSEVCAIQEGLQIREDETSILFYLVHQLFLAMFSYQTVPYRVLPHELAEHIPQVLGLKIIFSLTPHN